MITIHFMANMPERFRAAVMTTEAWDHRKAEANWFRRIGEGCMEETRAPTLLRGTTFFVFFMLVSDLLIWFD